MILSPDPCLSKMSSEMYVPIRLIPGLKENTATDITRIHILVYRHFCIFRIILILLLIKTSPIHLVHDTLSLLSQINNCFDTKSNAPYFWLVFLLYDIIYSKMICTENCHLGVTILFNLISICLLNPQTTLKND